MPMQTQIRLGRPMPKCLERNTGWLTADELHLEEAASCYPPDLGGRGIRFCRSGVLSKYYSASEAWPEVVGSCSEGVAFTALELYMGLHKPEDVPVDVNPISSKWVFKIKALPGGGIGHCIPKPRS
jgi:hypothetical protein